jgi:hypothetical protein
VGTTHIVPQVPAPGTYNTLCISSIASRVSSPSMPPSRYSKSECDPSPPHSGCAYSTATTRLDLACMCCRENSYAESRRSSTMSQGRRSSIISSFTSLHSPINSPINFHPARRDGQDRFNVSSQAHRTEARYSDVDSRLDDGMINSSFIFCDNQCPHTAVLARSALTCMC